MTSPNLANPSRLKQMLVAFRQHLRVLALEDTEPISPAPAYNLALLAAHFAGLLFVARLAHWPLWSAPALLAAFGLPQISRRRWSAETLAPLAWLYALAVFRLVWVYGRREPVPPALAYDVALCLSAAWSLLIVLRSAGRLWLAWVLAGAALAAVYTGQLWRLAPAGVTGSDPLAYVQMALDQVRHGSPLHHFPLAPFAASLGLPTLPVTHVGYILPDPAGWAPTVWPAGYSALLATAYRLGGERLLLGFNALVGFTSLILTATLTLQLAFNAPRPAAFALAGAAVALLATSPEQWVRLAVPLADGAAQLFTTAAVTMALWVIVLRQRVAASSTPPEPFSRDANGRRLSDAPVALLAILAGLTLSAAFTTRYTQALIAPGLVLVTLWALPGARPRWIFVLGLVAAGALVAAPDLLYRTRLYGAPWRFGTGELALFDVLAVPRAARQLAAEFLRPNEFGWFWPPALLGAFYLWRRHRLALILVVAAYAPVLGFHLLYPFVRLRDVLFSLAPVAAFSALGGAVIAGWLWRRGTAARLCLIATLLLLGTLRAFPLLSKAPSFFTFGRLLPEQRLALASLATLTEPTAVIACSLNSGAIELYSGRQTVRPGHLLQPAAAWTTDQWLTFADALRAESRPLYVLMDSPELEQPLSDLRSRFALVHIADLYVPVYVHTGGSENRVVALWRVQPNDD